MTENMWQKINKTDLPPYLSWRGYNTVEHKPNEIIEVNGKKVAIDRSVGVSIIVYTTDCNGFDYVLCNQRGKQKEDSGGLWNTPSGYLDWGETAEECAIREVYEECGIKIPRESVRLAEVSTDPKENRQNVIFRFIAHVPYRFMSMPLSSVNSEEGEVEKVAWLSLDEMAKIKFAWNQFDNVKRILKTEL